MFFTFPFKYYPNNKSQKTKYSDIGNKKSIPIIALSYSFNIYFPKSYDKF